MKKPYKRSPEGEARRAAASAKNNRRPEFRAKISLAQKGKWRVHVPSYIQAHARLGSLVGQFCSCGCGKQATTWALKPDTPVERILIGAKGYEGLRYSSNPNDYQPMTRSCHWKMDGHGVRLMKWRKENE